MALLPVYIYRLPEKYWNLKLPHKLPPRKEPLNITRLPMLGYMEASLSLPVTKAMTKCGNFKPKYPFLTTTQSALIYIAYHLKGKSSQLTTSYGCYTQSYVFFSAFSDSYYFMIIIQVDN